MSWPSDAVIETKAEREVVYLLNSWEAYKVARGEAVANIKVVTPSGKEFDGDETSQGRMSRAISVAYSDDETTAWKLADNTIVEVTISELKDALRLAGVAQTNIWMGDVEV